jgi:hypothetical protein
MRAGTLSLLTLVATTWSSPQTAGAVDREERAERKYVECSELTYSKEDSVFLPDRTKSTPKKSD